MQKMRVVLHQAWSESQWTVLMRYLTISTNVISSTSQMTTFSFRKTAHRCILHATQSNWVKMWFSCFPILTGSAEARVIWGGIVKRLLIAYFIGNISAPQKISKSIHVCQSYSKPKVGRFWDTVYMMPLTLMHSKTVQQCLFGRRISTTIVRRSLLDISYSGRSGALQIPFELQLELKPNSLWQIQ